MSVSGKNFNVPIFPNTVHVYNSQTLHDGSTHLALPIRTAFSDLDFISRSQGFQTVLTEIFMFLSD